MRRAFRTPASERPRCDEGQEGARVYQPGPAQALIRGPRGNGTANGPPSPRPTQPVYSPSAEQTLSEMWSRRANPHRACPERQGPADEPLVRRVRQLMAGITQARATAAEAHAGSVDVREALRGEFRAFRARCTGLDFVLRVPRPVTTAAIVRHLRGLALDDPLLSHESDAFAERAECLVGHSRTENTATCGADASIIIRRGRDRVSQHDPSPEARPQRRIESSEPCLPHHLRHGQQLCSGIADPSRTAFVN